MRARRDHHPQMVSPLCGGCTADKQRATTLPGDVWDDGWWGDSATRPTRKEPWAQCLVDHRVFRAAEGSTESVPLVFGVETVLWLTAAKKGGKLYRGVVEAAECFMTRWHRDEAESSWLRHATEDARSDAVSYTHLTLPTILLV